MYLIIDDDRTACLRLKILLDESGIEDHHLIFETDPFQALKIVSAQPIQLIFLDIEMPRMSGFKFWRKLDEQRYGGAVICTTAHDRYILEALRSQAMDYLLKPICSQELAEALDRFRAKCRKTNKDFEKLKSYGLTHRQVEIARRIFQGKTSGKIGEELFLSKHTVDTHRRNILKITGCKNTTELFTLL